MDTGVVTAWLHAAYHHWTNAICGDFHCLGIFPKSHQDPVETSDAREREDLGLRAFAFQWRPRLDPALRYVPGVGCLCPYRRQTPRRSRTCDDPGRLDQ